MIQKITASNAPFLPIMSLITPFVHAINYSCVFIQLTLPAKFLLPVFTDLPGCKNFFNTLSLTKLVIVIFALTFRIGIGTI